MTDLLERFRKSPLQSSMYRRQSKRFAGRDSRPLGDGDGDGDGDVRKRERIIWPRQPTGLNAFELVGASCLNAPSRYNNSIYVITHRQAERSSLFLLEVQNKMVQQRGLCDARTAVILTRR